ncbi:carbohydrate ABC transporter permease [Paenibacillus bovis]|uniref:ABC transporter permease n=1 Tax=Paenibacillus bovis TaxID=1616788 RepID=A0A172ZLA1_9BACL|nr:sugar ABC transporter permease [Paenibacillus bovis]ANF98319.1 ABC transporter permease [Paenibacillus bovis]
MMVSENTQVIAGQQTTAVRKKWLRSTDIAGWCFVLPLLVGVLGFSLYPMVSALLTSFRGNGAASAQWVGLTNYSRVLQDDLFWGALYNTIYIGGLSAILGIVFSFILASLVHHLPWQRTRNLFKAIFFLPNVVSAVATSLLFSLLFHPGKEGLINYALNWFGIDPVGWFTDPSIARLSVVFMILWSALGYNTIIFLAALQSVPREQYEAADIDGASALGKWRYITIPSLRPIFLFMIVMGVINGMKQFTNVWLIGGSAGNPSGALMTSVLYIYRNAFLSSQLGIATAASYLLFVFILLLTLVILKVNAKNQLN